MAKVTSWPPETLLAMGEAEFTVYLDFALRLHGVKAQEGFVAEPPPAGEPQASIPDEILSRLPPEARAHLER